MAFKASTSQKGKLRTTTVTSTSNVAPLQSAWTQISGVASMEAGAPIAGDIEATNLESTEIEMVDDLVEEASYPVTIQADFTEAAHRLLLTAQAGKVKRYFEFEVPEHSGKFTRYQYFGWVRNFRWSGSPRSVQQASFDILTRSAAVISHNQNARA